MWFLLFIVVGIFFLLYLKRSTSVGNSNGKGQSMSRVQATYSTDPPPPPIVKDYNCPHCGETIENAGRKRKRICPKCGKEFVHIYFRDKNLKKLFTPEEGAVHLKQQEAERQQERNRRWPELNRELSVYACGNAWPKYSFCRWEMANILVEEGREKEALRHLLSKCYLDLNGPCDLSGLSIKEAAEMGMKPFDPKQKLIPPATIRLLVDIIEDLNLPEDEVKRSYFEDNFERNLKLPRNMDKCWQELRAILFD